MATGHGYDGMALMDRYAFDQRLMLAAVTIVVVAVYLLTRIVLAVLEPSVCVSTVGVGEPAYVHAVTCR